MAKIPGLATVVQKGRELQHRRAHKKAHKQALEQHNQHIETLHPGNPKKAAEAFLRVMHPTSPRHPNQATSLELTHGVLSSGKKGSVLEHMLNRKLEKGKRANTFAEFSEALFGTVRDPNLKEQLTGELAERLQKVDRDARQVRIGTLVSRVITSSLTFAINPILGGTIAAASLILPTSKRFERRAVRAEVRKLVKQKYEKVAQQHLDNFEKLITGITAPLTNPPTERSGERHKQAFSFASAFVEDLKKRHLIPENATPQDAAKFIKKALDWQKEFNSLDPTTRKRSRLKLGRKLSKKAMQEVAHSRAIIAALEDHLINLEPNKVPENLRRRLEAYQKGRQRLLELGQVIHNLPQALGKAPKLSKIREELQGRKVHHNPFIRSLQYIVKLIKLTPGAIAGTLEAGAAAAFGYALGSVTMAITGGTLGVPIIITAATFFAATEARRLYKIHKTPEKMPYGSHTNAHERSRARIQQLNAKAAKENPGIGKRAGKAAVRLAKNAAKGAGKAVIRGKTGSS